MSTSTPNAPMGRFSARNRALIAAATDLSDGGLALAAFEMAEAAGIGVTLDFADTPLLFGEDQARYLIAASFDSAEALMVEAGKAGVPLLCVGRFGGDMVDFDGAAASLAELSSLYRGAFADAVG